MTAYDWKDYPLRLAKGQQLSLQKMLRTTVPGGDICTVIDDGLLNTASSQILRKWIFENARVRAVVRLPEDTFKPNKINVRSSVLLLEKREIPDPDLDEEYNVTFIDINSLGYHGSGEPIRGFNLPNLLDEIEKLALGKTPKSGSIGAGWEAFDVPISAFKSDESYRLDLKYWAPKAIAVIDAIKKNGAVTVDKINLLKTKRGSSPKADSYVGDQMATLPSSRQEPQSRAME